MNDLELIEDFIKYYFAKEIEKSLENIKYDINSDELLMLVEFRRKILIKYKKEILNEINSFYN